MPTLKKDSEAWRLAVNISRRKGTSRKPISLSDDGRTVTFMSLIRDHKWSRSLEELRLIAKR